MERKKITVDDIRVYNPCEKIEKLIYEKYGNIEQFARRNKGKGYWLTPASIRRNLKKCNNSKFKFQSCAKLGISISEIEKPPEKQIEELTQYIIDNLDDYKNDFKLLDKMKRLAIKYNMKFETARMTREIGIYYWMNKNSEKSLVNIEFAISILEDIKDNHIDVLVNYITDVAIIEYRLFNYDKSLEHYRKSEKIIEEYSELIPDRFKYKHYYNFGLLLLGIGKFDESFKNLQDAIMYCENNKIKICGIYNNIAISFKKRKQYCKAIEYYNKTLDFCNRKGSIAVSVYNNLSNLYCILGENDMAIRNIKKCFEANEYGVKNERFVIYYKTYVSILMKTGRLNNEWKGLLKAIQRSGSTLINKKYILEAVEILTKVKEAKKELIQTIKILTHKNEDNVEFKKELLKYLEKLLI